MKTEWRPDDWNTKTPFSFDVSRVTFEAGASAMLSALLKYLFEPCDKHPEKELVELPFKDEWMEFYPEHRKDCPQCLSELKEANK